MDNGSPLTEEERGCLADLEAQIERARAEEQRLRAQCDRIRDGAQDRAVTDPDQVLPPRWVRLPLDAGQLAITLLYYTSPQERKQLIRLLQRIDRMLGAIEQSDPSSEANSSGADAVRASEAPSSKPGRRNRFQPWPPETRALALELHQQGLTNYQISKRIGVPDSTVASIVKRHYESIPE